MPRLSNACSVTCKDFPKEIPPYSDIGGIGVTVAFIVTAWLVVVVLVGYYLTAFDPRLDPFREEDTQTLCKHPNAVDYSIRKILPRVPGLGNTLISDSARSSRLKAVLTDVRALSKSNLLITARFHVLQCVLMFADIQIFTALAILISAFASLGCDIVTYHWQYMIYLAWLASVTHLASLSFLRNHLARNRVKCIWRLTAMAIIQVLLSVAVGLSTTFGGDPWLVGKGGRPAICYFGERPDTKSVAFQSAIKMILLLTWGLVIRIAKMFEVFEGGLRRIASQLYQKSRERQYGTGATTTDGWDPRSHTLTLGSLFKPILIAFLAMLSIQIDLFTSFLAEAYWLLFSIIWITIRLNELRTSSPRDDSEWSFGQILPLILLVAPLAIALENFYTKAKNIIAETTGAPHLNEITNGPDHIRELQHVDTVAYRGALLLALLSYLEIGVYFIFIQQASDGLITPVVYISISMLFSNPFLQMMWISFDIWMSQASWKVTSKSACYDTVLQSFVPISLTTNFAALISGHSLLHDQPFLFGILTNCFFALTILFVCNLSFALAFVHNTESAIRGFIESLVFLGVLFFFTRVVATFSKLALYMPICTAGFLFLLLTNYGLQLLVERKHFSTWLVLCLRCILAIGVGTVVLFIPSGIPVGALASSFQICIVIFTGSRLVSQFKQSE